MEIENGSKSGLAFKLIMTFAIIIIAIGAIFTFVKLFPENTSAMTEELPLESPFYSISTVTTEVSRVDVEAYRGQIFVWRAQPDDGQTMGQIDSMAFVLTDGREMIVGFEDVEP